MSLTITYRASIYSTTGAETYTASPAWTPTANSLLVAFVLGSLASSPNDPTVGVTGHGQTYTKLTLSANTVGTTHAVSVWVANAGGSPSSVAAKADWTGAGNRTGGSVIEFEITGWGGTSAANAIVQNPTSNNGGSASTGFSFSLAAAQKASNMPMSYWVHLANEATSPRASWTETAGADGNFNNPATGAEAQFRTDAFETTASATWTSSVVGRGVALEIRAQDTTTKTQTSVANIRATTTKTQSSIARIRITTTRTQTSVANISTFTTVQKTQTSVARIQKSVPKTQTSVARVQITTPRTQVSVARVQATTPRTQPSTARIQVTAPLRTQTSVARVQLQTVRTQPSVANIRGTMTRTQTSVSNIFVPGTEDNWTTTLKNANINRNCSIWYCPTVVRPWRAPPR